jgi:biopolymer transport protein TolR
MKEPLVEPAPLMTKLNVTPIIDVALVLVIILMVTAPMLTVANLDLILPEAHSREPQEDSYLSISLSSDGQIAVDEEILAPELLKTRLRSRIDEKEDILVVVRADAGLSHIAVRSVLDQAKAAGAKRVAIATNQKAGDK